MTQNTLSQLVGILAKQTKRDPSEFSATTTLEDSGIDSLDFVEFLFLIEGTFDIDIDYNHNDPKARLNTLSDVAAVVDRLIAAKKTVPEPAV